MGFVEEKFEKAKKQNKATIYCWIMGKFLFGLGLGALLVYYLPHSFWQCFGWGMIILAIIVGLPMLRAMFK